MRGCFRGFFFGSIISCRACLARDAAHRHIVATNSAGPDVPCVKCCHFNGLQAYIGSIRCLSGCNPVAIAVIPAKSLSSPVPESRLRGSGAALASAVASSEGIRSCGNPAPVIAINDSLLPLGDRLVAGSLRSRPGFEASADDDGAMSIDATVTASDSNKTTRASSTPTRG